MSLINMIYRYMVVKHKIDFISCAFSVRSVHYMVVKHKIDFFHVHLLLDQIHINYHFHLFPDSKQEEEK